MDWGGCRLGEIGSGRKWRSWASCRFGGRGIGGNWEALGECAAGTGSAGMAPRSGSGAGCWVMPLGARPGDSTGTEPVPRGQRDQGVSGHPRHARGVGGHGGLSAATAAAWQGGEAAAPGPGPGAEGETPGRSCPFPGRDPRAPTHFLRNCRPGWLRVAPADPSPPALGSGPAATPQEPLEVKSIPPGSAVPRVGIGIARRRRTGGRFPSPGGAKEGQPSPG